MFAHAGVAHSHKAHGDHVGSDEEDDVVSAKEKEVTVFRQVYCGFFDTASGTVFAFFRIYMALNL